MILFALGTAGAVLLVAVETFILTLGGPLARSIAAFGLLRHRYGRHTPAGRREDSRPVSALRPAPVVVLPPAPEPAPPAAPIVALVHAAQGSDEYGAEHWGGLLDAMKTEEREIYDRELFELREATNAILRRFHADLDRTVAGIMAQWEHRTERVSLGSSESPTAAWPLVTA